MSILENPLLLPVWRSLVGALIGRENLSLYDTADWQDYSDFSYPAYYRTQNFHGIKGGYLNAIAPVTYDAITQFATPPSEIRQRQAAIAQIDGQPQRILDLGCGTGSSTLMLQEAFSSARVTGLDISPQMLTMARHKAKQSGLTIDWQQGLAETTNFADAEFDLVAIAFLFHETPVEIAHRILLECYRLLAPGGQIIILDGNQQRLRHTPWLIKLFREPYSQAYAAGNVDDWLEAAGFARIKTNPVGWISQLTTAFK
ncbi:MAG: class I SAM-dependent methyltransferase [Cyanobacteria bacterium J06623_7]